jgi:soluble lytic murein transglycosylase-like protein
MSVHNVYQNIESILKRIDSIKQRFGISRTSRFSQELREIEQNEEEKVSSEKTVVERNPGEAVSPAYDEIIEEAADRYRIPQALIRAVIKQESNFDPQAVSRKGAMGLMQLMPDTAELLGVNDPFSADENIFGGTEYLGSLIDMYGGNLNEALAAYNAGPQRVNNGVPNIRETRDFVDSVLHYYEAFTKYDEQEEF